MAELPQDDTPDPRGIESKPLGKLQQPAENACHGQTRPDRSLKLPLADDIGGSQACTQIEEGGQQEQWQSMLSLPSTSSLGDPLECLTPSLFSPSFFESGWSEPASPMMSPPSLRSLPKDVEFESFADIKTPPSNEAPKLLSDTNDESPRQDIPSDPGWSMNEARLAFFTDGTSSVEPASPVTESPKRLPESSVNSQDDTLHNTTDEEDSKRASQTTDFIGRIPHLPPTVETKLITASGNGLSLDLSDVPTDRKCCVSPCDRKCALIH